MYMKTQALGLLLVGLLIGIGGTAFAMKRMEMAATTTASTTSVAMHTASPGMDGMGMGSDSSSAVSSSMSMDQMMTTLQGKTGDDFDKTFIAEMIMHHQGAISMAKLASAQAKHQEVKDLANGIISAQTSEITEMQAWQKNWGY